MIYYEDGSFTELVNLALDANKGDIDAAILAVGRSDEPNGCCTRLIDTADLPGNGEPDASFDKTFFAMLEPQQDGTYVEHHGWTDASAGNQVDVHLPGAKMIAHARRRFKRAKEFAPLDVEATIPAKAAQAEAKRQAIRDKHANIQSSIDAATTAEELKAAAAEVL